MGFDNANLNLLTGNRAIAYIGTEKIDPSIKATKLAFNLTQFSVNQLTVDSNEMHYLGFNAPMPVSTRTDVKEVDFMYMPDSNLSQYRFLFNWLTKIASDGVSLGVEFETPGGGGLEQIMTDIHVVVLSEFKKPVVDFTYTNAWLQRLGELRFDFQSEGLPIYHEFTIMYERMIPNFNP